RAALVASLVVRDDETKLTRADGMKPLINLPRIFYFLMLINNH
ncbi:6407_t:CDS:1, partial [Funneliformis geosporum]